MSSDLKAILQLPEARVTQPNVQVEKFGHAFRQQIDGVNRPLRVLTAQASPTELQPLEDQRRKLMEAFQKTVALIDPADPTKAGKAIERVMAAVDMVGGKATEAAAGVLAGHEDRSRGRTYIEARIRVRETHAFGGHAVEVRRFDARLAIAAEVPVTEVVGEDEDHVR